MPRLLVAAALFTVLCTHTSSAQSQPAGTQPSEQQPTQSAPPAQPRQPGAIPSYTPVQEPPSGQYPPPVQNIDPSQHGNLSAAQSDIVDAYQRIENAQAANNNHLGGHAQRAKDLLAQADAELRSAADVADADQPPPPGFANASGHWNIYANDINDPGGSEKYVDIQQYGNQLSGHFKGPHQSGKISGFVNNNHIEFSTDTRDVITFRGHIDGNTMSGMYGIHGQHASWNAVRSY